ncbi:MAG: PASTA domain-containing protein [Bacteroidota bacterium]
MEFFKKLKSFVWSKHFLKHLGLVALTYIVLVGGTIFYLDFSTNHGEKIKVPILVGRNVKNIQPIIDELGLQYEVLDSLYYPNKPVGTIVSQDPRPTDSTDVYVKSGRIIRVRVSKKTRLVEMPSLIDKSERFALSVLKNRGLKYKITYKATSESDGAVLQQKLDGKEIKGGAKVSIGSVIYLVVGRNEGSSPVQIPNLIGLTISEVKSRLSGMSSLTLFENYINCTNASDSSSAKVFSQSPEYIEGMMSPSSSTISIQLDKNYSGGDGNQNPL